MDDESITIRFHDFAENQDGIVVVRTYDHKVALCLSLERNGDVEAVMDKEAVKRVIEALQKFAAHNAP